MDLELEQVRELYQGFTTGNLLRLRAAFRLDREESQRTGRPVEFMEDRLQIIEEILAKREGGWAQRFDFRAD